MTKFVETKMVEQTTVKYVADDGKEFVGESAKLECECHERRANRTKVEKAFKRLNATELSIPFIEFFYGDESGLLQVELTSKADYYTLIDYLVVVCGCYESDLWIDEPKEYPATKLIARGCEWANEYKNDLKEQLQKTLEQLG